MNGSAANTILLQQTQAAIYITLATFTVATWDWILSSEEEYLMIQRCGLSISVMAYLLTRASTVLLCIASLLFQIPNDISCAAMFTIVSVMSMLGSISKGYLFLLRVRAVYGNSILINVCLGMGWLAVVGTRMAVPIMVQGTSIYHTGYCSISGTQWSTSFPVVGLWSNLIFDSCVFVLISVRLILQNTGPRTIRTSWTSAFKILSGGGLPPFMRHILQDGQIYYFATVGLTLLAAIMAILPVGPVLKSVFSPPALIIETTMTCKVFRSVIVHLPQGREGQAVIYEPGTLSMSDFELDTQLSTRMAYNDQ